MSDLREGVSGGRYLEKFGLFRRRNKFVIRVKGMSRMEGELLCGTYADIALLSNVFRPYQLLLIRWYKYLTYIIHTSTDIV